MEHNQTNHWITIASQEHSQREQLQLELHALKQQLQQAKQEFATVLSYNAQIEKKLSAAESERSILQKKLNTSVEMLKKAQVVLRKRKQEIQRYIVSLRALQTQNTSLETALQEEQFSHAQTNDKLKEIVATSNKQHAQLTAQSKRTAPGSNTEFAFKLLYAPPNPGTASPSQALQNDVDLIAKMVYLDEQTSAQKQD